MTPVEFASLVRSYTDKNSTNLPDALILTFANIRRATFAQRVEELDESFFDMVQRADLVAGQREYQLPDEVLNRIKFVEIFLDSTWTSYKACSEARLNIDRVPTDEASIVASYSDSNPKYLLQRKSILLLTSSAIPTMANGIRLTCGVYPKKMDNLTDVYDMATDPTADQLGFPLQLHELLARAVSVDYKESRDIPLPLSALEQRLDIDLDAALNQMCGGNTDRSTSARLPYNDGSQY